MKQDSRFGAPTQTGAGRSNTRYARERFKKAYRSNAAGCGRSPSRGEGKGLAATEVGRSSLARIPRGALSQESGSSEGEGQVTMSDGFRIPEPRRMLRHRGAWSDSRCRMRLNITREEVKLAFTGCLYTFPEVVDVGVLIEFLKASMPSNARSPCRLCLPIMPSERSADGDRRAK
jgi:hypothetical protein